MIAKTLKTCLAVAAIFFLVFTASSWCADLKDGIDAYESGDYDQAIKLINKYLQEKPRDEKAYYYLGRCYYEMGDLNQAIVEYDKALDIQSRYWQAYYGKGQAYLQQGKLEDAERTFQEGLNRKERPEFHSGLGLVQMAKGMLKEADLSFRKAISMDEKNAEFHKNLGDVNFEKGVLVIAMQEYNTALELDSTLVEVYFNLAQAYLKQVRFNDAMEAFKTAIRVDPENKEAYLKLGEIYMLDGKHYPEARIIYEEYLKFGDENSVAFKNLGISYYFVTKILPSLVVNGDTLDHQKMAERAILHLEKASSLNAEDPETYFYIGKTYQDMNKFPEALDAFLKYEKIQTEKDYEWTEKDADFWVSKGQVQGEIGDSASLDAAIISLTKGIELDSTKTSAYSSLGKALFDQGKYQEAIPFFQKRIETDSNNVSAYFNLAYGYIKLEKYKEAVGPLTKVVQLKPDNAGAQDLLARVYFNLNNYEKAKDAYLEVLRLDPSKCDINKNVGYCYLQMKNPSVAVPYLKKAVGCFPKDVNSLLMLAQALETSKNIDEAYQYYLKVLEIDPKNQPATDGRDRIDMQKF